VTTQVYAHAKCASFFYRLAEPARVLGVEVVEHPGHVTADTVVTQRPLLPELADLVVKWVAEGRRVVVDSDDSFDHLDPAHGIHGHYKTEHYHRACKAATVNTTTTPGLAKLYGYGKAAVLPNCVPESYLRSAPRGRRSPEPWIGWSGSISAHPNDLAVTGAGIAKAIKSTRARVVYLGPERDEATISRQLSVRDVMPLGFVSLLGFPSVIAEYDIGIVPLEPIPFNTKMKSWLKGIELAACGVPVVASPTEDYRRLAKLGACLLAKTPAHWYEHVSRLLHDESFRSEQAQRGREAMRDWTYEKRADLWREAWGL
jgi:glycosyltransferase involved in cell wall biosynthesis